MHMPPVLGQRAVPCPGCGKSYMFFCRRNFTQIDGMRTIGGRDHFRETRTHSAELSSNFV